MNRKLTLACSLLAVMIGPSLADTPAPASKITRTFDILREGSKIGTVVEELEKQGDMTTVKFKTHISVVVMFIEAYHVDHASSETWNGNQLVSFKSQKDENGKKHSVSATVVGDKIDLEADGKHSELPRTAIPSSMWSRAFVSATQMFDDGDGKRLVIKVSDLGDENLEVKGAKHQVRHYQISGDFKRDLWFEGDTLLRLKLTGSDGSKITSELRP
jgi:hypothetical protein